MILDRFKEVRVNWIFSSICIISVFFIACSNSSSSSTSDIFPSQSTLPYYSEASFTPHWREGNDTAVFFRHTISDFHFTNQKGDTVGSRQLKGKIYVAGFFFTACPGICPRLISKMKQVQDTFLYEPGVQLISFSVTPETDGVKELDQYAGIHGIVASKWWLLTGNRDSIYRLARHDFFADEDMGGKKGSNDFLHTENLLLIDREGYIRGVYKGTSPADINWLIRDIHLLLKP